MQAVVNGKAVLKPRSVNGNHANGNGKPPDRLTARDLAALQREISVSEFFTKNRHLLGFDNPTRALLTAIKEAVDNSLDACEEAGILPEIHVTLKARAEDRFVFTVEDNGPGIVPENIGKVFGKLLYGSKFHRLKMARGQQGIGISAVCLYAQLTTGKPLRVISRIDADHPAYQMEVQIDTAKNEPVIHNTVELPKWKREHGTLVEAEIEGRYTKGDKSVDEYLRQTFLANPHVTIHYQPPGDEPKVTYARVTQELPRLPKEIKPHPYGVELGTLMRILQGSRSKTLAICLKNEFSRVSDKVAEEILARAGLDGGKRPGEMTPQEFEALYRGIEKTKIMAPPTDCIAPIGEETILKALRACVRAEFFTSVSRPPDVYRGNPFLVEVGLAYGVEGHPPEDEAVVHRYANRVPLLYQPGACAITKAVEEVDWKNYGLEQSKDSIPRAPMLLMVHLASVWVPFTSEAKEAIAHYPEILKEIKLALQEAGRRLSIFVSRKRRAEHQAMRRSLFERYIEEVSAAIHELGGGPRERIRQKLLRMARGFTQQAEAEENAQEGEGR